MLVRAGLVSAKALEAARAAVSSQGGTLGEYLVAAGAITDDALTEFYRHRLLVPQVSPNALAKLKPKVIAALSPDLAIELRAIPVTFDPDGNLMVAMSDPSDRHAVDQVGFFTGKYIVRAVATQMQIAWCLAHYYGHVTALGRRLMQPREPAASAAPAPTAPSTAAVAAAAAAAASARPAPSPSSAPPRTSSGSAVSPAAPIQLATAAKAVEPAPREIEIEADAPPPAPAPKPRRAPADLVELESRAGEVQAPRPQRTRSLTDEPRVVVAFEPTEAPGAAALAAAAVTPVLTTPAPAVARSATDVPTVPAEVLSPSSAATDQAADKAADEATDPLGAAIRQHLDDEDSAPILLTRRSATRPPLLSPDTPAAQGVISPRRSSNMTQVGIGAIGPANATPRAHRDTDVGVPPGDAGGPPPPDSAPVAAPPAVGNATEVMRVPPEFLEQPPAAAAARLPDSVDDQWSAPNPTRTSVIPGGDAAAVDADAPVLMPSVGTAPVAVAGALAVPVPVDPAKELTAATARLVQLLRDIDAGQSRDEIVSTMLAHLSEAHLRAGFFVVRGAGAAAELSVFSLAAARAPGERALPSGFERGATLALAPASTIGDVVRTQLPYRGQVTDDLAGAFLQAALGDRPTELLLIPMVMRDRVVGVLFADQRHRYTFDDHYTIAARAAGIALERIVKAKKA
jgi:hypothetical protein